jgi:hypothetical protein
VVAVTDPIVCRVHGSHRPAVITLHVHHVQPISMGGPNEPENKVIICPTGHFNVHAVLAALVFDKPAVPKATRMETELAHRGYEAWLAAGRPGNPHGAYGLHVPGVVAEDDPSTFPE